MLVSAELDNKAEYVLQCVRLGWDLTIGIFIYLKLPLAPFAASKLLQKRTTKKAGRRLISTAATGRSNVLWISMMQGAFIHHSRWHDRNLGTIFQTRGIINLSVRG